MKIKKSGTLLISFLMLSIVVMAQQKMVADKIVAIVGDKIILQSELEGQYNQMARQQGGLPPNAKCQMLEQMMAQKALVLQAEKDSLPVSDEEVNGEIENRIRYFEQLYGSREKMEQITGQSLYQIKENFRQAIHDLLLARAEKTKIDDAVKITPTEVKEYYSAIPKDSLPYFESEVEVGQLVINPKPSKEIIKYTINQLNDLKKQVENGKKSFQVLASLYSDDKGTGDNILTLHRNDNQYDPDFLAAAFSLKTGEISTVIKSQFGYHIIQMVHRQGDVAQVRHILLKPQITQPQIDDALKRLDSIRSQVIAGNLDFEQAATQYSDDQNAKMTAGMLENQNGSTYLTIDQLPDRQTVLQVGKMKPGDISKPEIFKDPYGNQSTHIIYLKSRTKPHRENMDDDYAKIQQQALQEKQDNALQKWFDEKMPTFYIKVDKAYQDCSSISSWLKPSTASNY